MKGIKNKISKIYYYTLGRICECAKLYRIDLHNFESTTDFESFDNFSFFMPGKTEMPLIERLYASNSVKIELIERRFGSDDYLCFAYRDNILGHLAYVRWICKNSFYSETMRRQLSFSENEALTLDSYSHPDYRKKGLHLKMNVFMLQWIKRNTEIRYVYMVIRCFIPHLTKIPIELGYKSITKSFYYKKGSFSFYFNLLINKLFFDAKTN
ncbi:MAG: hypothetical protein K9I95_14690 [Flavobacteriaceae bacterium]|nr:hypothetical protein [Flavobacteriaceae bacterium]